MIQINNISKSYDDVKAVKDVSLEINRAELFGFIGPDGAGKSTLFRILTTLLLADKGDAYINDLHIVKDYKKIRQILGYMPGRFYLYNDLIFEENLDFYETFFGTTV